MIHTAITFADLVAGP